MLDHYDRVFNESVKNTVNDINVESNDGIQEEETFDDILDCEISEQEVRNATRHLKAGKSAGPDYFSRNAKSGSTSDRSLFEEYL